VALTPAAVGRLVKAGHEVLVEQDAGNAASFPDRQYTDAGARVVTAAEAFGAELVVKVQPPTLGEAERFSAGAILVSLLRPYAAADLLDRLAERRVSGLAMERVPRTTKAQSMDVLSSQATVAGYQAVLLGATRMTRFLPMLTTAAGTITPAKCFIIGAGVAGLQAIATARRLGAVVSAFDVRPVVKEQVQSLGASFVEAGAAAEAAGGYAKELAADEQQRVLDAIAGHIRDMDLVISTAAIPGKPAPRLITRAMVESMKAGAVIVDVAAETGGNCELTTPGETIQVGGVTILGPLNLASSLPRDASLMYGNNVLALIQYAVRDGRFDLDPNDPIVGPMLVHPPAPAGAPA
jgi:NAD(P) transhydrogenase subunit alpha